MRPTPGATAARGGWREGLDEEFAELASARDEASVSCVCGGALADGGGGPGTMAEMLMKI
jgi:hypothetical protein